MFLFGAENMTHYFRHRMLLFFPLFLGVAAWGDVVELGSGESLSGSIVRVDDGVLVFRTSLKGQIMAPVDTLKSLSSEANLMLVMTGGGTLYGRLTKKDDRTYLVPLDRGATRPVDLAQIQSAMVIPSTPSDESLSKEALQEWRATIQSGVVVRDARPGYVDSVSRVEAGRDTGDTRLRAEALVERADPKDFPRLLRGTASASGSGEAGAAPFAEVQAERDLMKSLDLRTGLSLGLFQELVQTPKQQISGAAGINVTHETWDNARTRAAHEYTVSDDELNLHLGLRYSRILFGSSELASQLTVFPSLIDTGEVRARSDTAVTVPLIQSRLLLRLNVLLDYEPARNRMGPDELRTEFGAGLGLKF